MHTNAGIALDNRVTLTFDLLTSRSMHAERMPWTSCLAVYIRRSVLIAETVFLLERGETKVSKGGSSISTFGGPVGGQGFKVTGTILSVICTNMT